MEVKERPFPKISIIIPTYNAASHIASALKSIVAQTYPHKEIILVDGASTDDTLLVVEQFKAHIAIVVSEPDRGIYDAMNKGIDLATGDWIYFLGSDDTLYTPTVLADVFGSGAWEAYDVLYGEVMLQPSGEAYDGSFDLYKLYRRNIAHQSLFIRRHVFGVTGKFNLKYKSWADYELNLKWFAHPALRSTYINKIIANYNTGGFSQHGDPVFQQDKAALFRQYGTGVPPRVSVIVPVYNRAVHLEKRIVSILNQSYPFLEVIVLGNGSTDGSREIIDKYAGQDERVKPVFLRHRAGSPGALWNQGAELTHGEYLWIAEPDDFADPAFLEQMVGILDVSPELGVAYCQSWIVNEQDAILGNYTQWLGKPGGERWEEGYVLNGSEEISRHLIHRNVIASPSAVVFRRTVFLQAGKADAQLHAQGDWLLWLKMLMLSKAVYLAGHFNFFRLRHPERKEKRLGAHAETHVTLRKRFGEFLVERPNDANQRSIYYLNQLLMYNDMEEYGVWQIQHGNPWRGLGKMLALSFYPKFNLHKIKAGLYHLKKRLGKK